MLCSSELPFQPAMKKDTNIAEMPAIRFLNIPATRIELYVHLLLLFCVESTLATMMKIINAVTISFLHPPTFNARPSLNAAVELVPKLELNSRETLVTRLLSTKEPIPPPESHWPTTDRAIFLEASKGAQVTPPGI